MVIMLMPRPKRVFLASVERREKFIFIFITPLLRFQEDHLPLYSLDVLERKKVQRATKKRGQRNADPFIAW